MVELLVVISIIGMLAALLLPAVNAAREAGRKSVCVNNQRQIGIAIFQYEAAKNVYPGYVNAQAEIPFGQVKVASRPISWVFLLASRLERNDLAENYGVNAPKPWTSSPTDAGPWGVPNQALKVLVCPSDANASDVDPEGIGDQAALSYVVNCGMRDMESNSAVNGLIKMDTLVDSAKIPRDLAANGIFHYHFPYSGPSEINYSEIPYTGPSPVCLPTSEKITKVTSSMITDGTSTTLLLSENVDSGNWVDVLEQHVGFYWQATRDANNNAVPAFDGQYSSLVDPHGSAATLLRINEQTGLSGGSGNAIFGRPSSYHSGGVVVTYADSHTAFLNSDINYLTYCLLMSPRGKYTQPNSAKGIGSDNSPIMFVDPNYFPTTDARSQYARSTLNEGDL